MDLDLIIRLGQPKASVDPLYELLITSMSAERSKWIGAGTYIGIFAVPGIVVNDFLQV
jgi:hypothetical protein